MFSFTLTKNNNADHDYFEYWLKNNYATYDGISEEDTSVEVIFTDAIDSATQTTITDFYNALTTSDTITNFELKIYGFLSDYIKSDREKTEPPCDINYRVSLTKRLNPIITDVYKGEVREITYYENVTLNADGTQTGDNPIVKETFAYTRDSDLLVISRVMKIYWFMNNGDVFTTANERVKYYTSEQKIQEGQRRRKNIIDFMQIPVIGMIMQTEGVTQSEAITMGADFFDGYITEVNAFIATPRMNTLQDAVSNDTGHAWLDNVVNTPNADDTIRDYILDQLNY